jgi:hypothetical protein
MNNPKINKGTIKYQGKVTLQLYRGKQLLSTYSQHNEGLTSLFNGFCRLFAGEISASKLTPQYIAAYSLASTSTIPGTDASWESLTAKSEVSNRADLELASGFLPLESYTIDSNNFSITYKTKIPFSYISSEQICLLALFPKDYNKINPEESALACFRLADSTSWRPIHCPKTEAENTLLVEWQLRFSDGGEE